MELIGKIQPHLCYFTPPRFQFTLSDYELAMEAPALAIPVSESDQTGAVMAQSPSPVPNVPGQLVPAHGSEETYVVLFDYAGQRNDELALGSGQLVALVSCDEPDWWKVRALDGSNRVGFFPASYLAVLYNDEQPLRVTQTIQVSDGETCEKLLRGQVSMDIHELR